MIASSHMGKYILKKVCSEPIENIENYEAALNDKNEVWIIHHRDEIDLNLSRKELIERGLYWNCPAERLIFLTRADHIEVHREMLKKCFRQCVGEENGFFKKIDIDLLYDLRVNKRLSAKEIGKIMGLTRHTVMKKLRFYNIKEVNIHIGKKLTEETKKKISAGRFGKNNPAYKDIDLQELNKLYLSGLKIEEIANILNISKSTVRRRLKTIII